MRATPLARFEDEAGRVRSRARTHGRRGRGTATLRGLVASMEGCSCPHARLQAPPPEATWSSKRGDKETATEQAEVCLDKRHDPKKLPCVRPC